MKRKIINQENKVRLDKYLTETLKTEFDFSRAYIQKMISEKKVLVNGKDVNANFVLKPNDEIEIDLTPVEKPEIVAEDIPIKILYEDDDLLVVDKPNNMVVHPAIGNYSGTLVNALMHQITNLSSVGGAERPGIVHRLDKQTSGVMLVAKNDKVHKKLSAMFAKNEVKKTYLALVQGVIKEDEAIIDAPVGRHQNDRKKMAVTNKNAKQAKTHFKVLERFKNATLVEVDISTGRTHQIRVHFKYINHPVINDPQYGLLREKTTDYGQYLHSYQIDFVHPTLGTQMHFESPIPQEFNDKIKELRKAV